MFVNKNPPHVLVHTEYSIIPGHERFSYDQRSGNSLIKVVLVLRLLTFALASRVDSASAAIDLCI